MKVNVYINKFYVGNIELSNYDMQDVPISAYYNKENIYNYLSFIGQRKIISKYDCPDESMYNIVIDVIYDIQNDKKLNLNFKQEISDIYNDIVGQLYSNIPNKYFDN